MRFSGKDGYRSAMIVVLDNTIPYIATMLQVGDLCGKQAGLKTGPRSMARSPCTESELAIASRKSRENLKGQSHILRSRER